MQKIKVISACILTGSMAGMTAPIQAANELLAEHIEDYSSSPSSNLPGCDNTTDRLFDEFGDAGGWTRTRATGKASIGMA